MEETKELTAHEVIKIVADIQALGRIAIERADEDDGKMAKKFILRLINEFNNVEIEDL